MNNEYYPYSQNRFAGLGIPGLAGPRTTQQAFDFTTSANYRKFHQMRTEMPVDVLELFKANEIGFVRAPKIRRCRSLDPVTTLGINMIDKFQIPNLEMMEVEKKETRVQKKNRVADARAQTHRQKNDEKIKEWNPFQSSQCTQDPQKTLLVARLNYKTTEKSLKYEFEKYGIIKSVRIVHDKQGNSRGYGFIEFDSKNDFIAAYKQANHRKVDGKKVVIDFEKGRTLLKWKPRRFGGGEGGQQRMTPSEIKERDHQDQLNKERKEKRDRERTRRHKERSHSRSRSFRKEKRHQEKDRQVKKDKKDRKDKKDKREKKDKEKEEDGVVVDGQEPKMEEEV